MWRDSPTLERPETVHDVTPRIARLGEQFRQQDVFMTWSIIDLVDHR
ncbi:MAG: hypothetical protein WBM46_15215 [Polyangiales bacterium]|jgi:hypothetical protein